MAIAGTRITVQVVQRYSFANTDGEDLAALFVRVGAWLHSQGLKPGEEVAALKFAGTAKAPVIEVYIRRLP